MSDQDPQEVVDVKELIAQKLTAIANCLENNRLGNIAHDLDNSISMLIQLSQFTDVDSSLDFAENALQFVCQIADLDKENSEHYPYDCKPDMDFISKGHLGFIIPFETLQFFVENNFKVTDMANILGVSKRTVERRLQQYDLHIGQHYSKISDEELDKKVQELIKDFPHVGYRTVLGLLCSKGYRVQEYRIRQSMRNVDPCGVLFRRLFTTNFRIQRRTYSVSGPLALWHIDGYHKLIRWRFVIHGGIDGYSRLPVYMKVNDNNKAETVLSHFVDAVQEYGLPRRVRSGEGGRVYVTSQKYFS